MQRLRSLHHKNRYTQLANDAIDTLPDLESLGLLATILRHSDEFDFQMSVLIKSKPGLGADRAYKARRTLVEHGYVVQVKFKHTYRGRFCTDIYRSAEPHTAEDLALLRERYAPGQTVTLADDNGQEQVVTVTWAEVTSALGQERILADEPVDNSAAGETSATTKPAKPQVAPDPGFPGSGRPGSGPPGSGPPDPGEPGSFKEDCSEESEKEDPDPEDGRTEQPPAKTDDEYHQAATELVRRLSQEGRFARVGAYESQVWQVRDDVAGALAAGYAQSAVEAYLVAKLDMGGKVVFVRNAFDPSRLPDIAGYAPAPATPAVVMPQWCGRCDDEGRDKPSLRRIEIDGAMRPCPDCHPKAVVGR